MSQVKVHYQDDLPPIAVELVIDGVKQAIPSHDFILRFWAESPSRYSEVGRIGGAWRYCEPTDNEQLICYVKNRGLGIGRLMVDFISKATDSRYKDDVRVTVVRTALDVELVVGEGNQALTRIGGAVAILGGSVSVDVDAVLSECRSVVASASDLVSEGRSMLDELQAYDLSAYYTKTETNTLLEGKQSALHAGEGINIHNGVVSAEIEPLGTWDVLSIINSAW